MAHSCPECDMPCHCGGDIDDCQLDGTTEQMNCSHCAHIYDEDDGEDDERISRCDICGMPQNTPCLDGCPNSDSSYSLLMRRGYD